MRYRKILEKPTDINEKIHQAGYKELSNNIFCKRVKNKNIIAVTTKKYIMFGISSLA